ncbi:MAG TPA: OmpH family outer membrane protein [Candidatus Sulfotelmatobacter sp.]|jgi:Skp family chaperone for outer membrane proteins|nr:OmpH family outer membrane protein [Candidatus Sulfotelmatobacter sp.]
MTNHSGARLLVAGCLSAIFLASVPALAEDNGFGIGNGGGGGAPISVPPPSSGAAAPAAAAPSAAPASAPAPGAAKGVALTTPVIAVLDVDMVMGQSSAAKSVAAQREKWQQTYQSELSAQESTLRETRQKLDSERASMKPEEFQEKARAFEQSAGEFERKVIIRRRALDKSSAIAMGQVERAMIETSAQVAGSHNVNMVLPRSQVILFADSMNISKEVIDALNKKLAKVDMPAPVLESETGDKTEKKK